MSKIVIALGGNALGKNPSEQLSLLKDVAKIIVDLVKDGNKIILTHGNGPQVGQIALAMEYASNGKLGYTPQNSCYTYLEFENGKKININDIKVTHLE